MTTIDLPSGMTLPMGTRHAGLVRLTAGASLVHRLLAAATRALEARRLRTRALHCASPAIDEHGPRPFDGLHAGLPRALGD